MKHLAIIGFFITSILTLSCAKTAPVVEYKRFAKDSDVPRISVTDAKKDYDDQLAVMVDTRPQPAYDSAHIAGAISIPFGTGENKFSTLPQGKKIILYCD